MASLTNFVNVMHQFTVCALLRTPDKQVCAPRFMGFPDQFIIIIITVIIIIVNNLYAGYLQLCT